MNLPILLLIVGFAYVVLFGGISLLRREGLSWRFAVESVIITGIVSGLTAMSGSSTHPVVFLILLYLVTMRVRLLVDLGNIFAQRRQFSQADRLYRAALGLWPDTASYLIVQVNQATSWLQQNRLDDAIEIFSAILKQAEPGHLGVKYEAAAHYNLGVAYKRKNMDAHAAVEFNAVLDTWPASEYARRAQAALEHRRRKASSISEEN